MNVIAVRTAEGLVLVDTGSFHPAQHERSFDAVRRYAKDPVHTAIYTHGHVDHAYGLPPFLREAESQRWARPAIVGHVDVAPRMRRYIETAGYNGIINTRQFGAPVQWPIDPDYPTDRVPRRAAPAGRRARARALPRARRDGRPHLGVDPGRAGALHRRPLHLGRAERRQPAEGAALRARLGAGAAQRWRRARRQVLLPGHGLPIFGAERVRAALLDTADYLDSLYRQTLEALNRGASVYEIIETVKPPAALAEAPYLQPVYDEPEFIVRNVVRCLGGWYSGVPSELKPAPRAQQARELRRSSPAASRPLLARASALLAADDLRMASHWVDWAAEAEPDSREVHTLRAAVYARRVELETSTMSKGIFRAAANDSSERAKPRRELARALRDLAARAPRSPPANGSGSQSSDTTA